MRPFTAALLLSFCAAAAQGRADTTLVLDAPHSEEVTDAYIRGGDYAHRVNNSGVLVTRASDNSAYERRALLKFDTNNTIPAGATIKSATLTLTVMGGNAETRKLSAYSVTQSWQEAETTWYTRKGSQRWSSAGGDFGAKYDEATATGTPGAKVNFDLTKLVQEFVNGRFGSRWTRVGILDTGASTRHSYREFYSSEASSPAVRPALTVVVGSSSTGNTSSPAPSSSGTTVVINSPSGEQVTDAVIRGGSHANTVFNTDTLVTRASDSSSYERRSLLKFDTHNKVPQNANIQSATLILTVKGGNTETRKLSAYSVTQSWQESETTWYKRKGSYKWSSAGGDYGAKYAEATVTGTPGSKVSFDITKLVQEFVTGKFGSRWTRVAILDKGSSTRHSYREFHSSEASDASVRPMLKIVYGGTSAPSPSPSPEPDPEPEPEPEPEPAPAPTGSTLRVLDWNIHHGVGTDGKYDINRIADWIAKFKPDLISLNEVERYTSYGNEDQPARFASMLKAKTGRTWYYYFRSGTGSSSGHGNLVMSRFPIVSTSSCQLRASRSAANLAVVVNGRTINFWSTHLDSSSSSTRASQVLELLSCTRNFSQQRIIAGDFNTQDYKYEIQPMLAAYYDAWKKASQSGDATSFPGNDGDTRNTRIDYVFHSEDATRLVLKEARVYDTRNSSGVRPSDHRPLMAVYEVR